MESFRGLKILLRLKYKGSVALTLQGREALSAEKCRNLLRDSAEERDYYYSRVDLCKVLRQGSAQER